MPLMSFDEAIADAGRYTKLHVLLGNGFSISCRPGCFRYDALLAEATFEGASGDIQAVFELLGTTDFEQVIQLMQLAADLSDAYGRTDPQLCARLRDDAAIVRDSLARVLAARHPNVPFDISNHEYASARRFLFHFERVYTLNYDMLIRPGIRGGSIPWK